MQDASFLPKDQFDGGEIKVKLRPDLVDHKAFIGKMNRIRFVYKADKGGRPGSGLCPVEETQSASAHSGRRMLLHYFF